MILHKDSVVLNEDDDFYLIYFGPDTKNIKSQYKYYSNFDTHYSSKFESEFVTTEIEENFYIRNKIKPFFLFVTKVGDLMVLTNFTNNAVCKKLIPINTLKKFTQTHQSLKEQFKEDKLDQHKDLEIRKSHFFMFDFSSYVILFGLENVLQHFQMTEKIEKLEFKLFQITQKEERFLLKLKQLKFIEVDTTHTLFDIIPKMENIKTLKIRNTSFTEVDEMFNKAPNLEMIICDGIPFIGKNVIKTIDAQLMLTNKTMLPTLKEKLGNNKITIVGDFTVHRDYFNILECVERIEGDLIIPGTYFGFNYPHKINITGSVVFRTVEYWQKDERYLMVLNNLNIGSGKIIFKPFFIVTEHDVNI